MKKEYDTTLIQQFDCLPCDLMNYSGLIENIGAYLDEKIHECNFLKDTPFLRINLTYRLGLKTNLKLEFGDVENEFKYLPISLALDWKILQWCDRNNLEILEDIFMISCLEALIQVGQEYDLPVDIFFKHLVQFQDFPYTLEELKQLKTLKLVQTTTY